MLSLQVPRLQKNDMVRIPKWAVSVYMTGITILLVVTIASLALVFFKP